MAKHDREDVLVDDAVHARTCDLLEWGRVTGLVAGHARCRRAAESLRARRPYADPAPIELRRLLADELRAEGDADRWPPVVEVSDLLDLLERGRPLRLEGEDLVHIAQVAADLDRFAGFCRARADACPVWSGAAAALPPFAALHAAVTRVFDRDGRMRDDASPLLARLRRREREQERSVRSEVSAAMARAKTKGWTTGPEVTLRGDRFCLPLRAGARRRIDGIVHDRSSSGGTIYMEPAAAVLIQNDLVETRLEASAEIDRILMDLNRMVEAAADDLIAAAELMLLCDETRAAMLWSRSVAGARPALEPGAALSVRRGRHPLLLARLEDPAAVTPLDLEMPADRRALVISGPNAGGKSVALKGVGVLIMLAQCGWDVPAREDTTLPLVDRICVDLGDEQSIEMSLSSFTAHLSHLSRFLDLAGPRTLVLCDEIGSGTDPDEGTALAFSVLEELAGRGALVLASTHYGLLKAAAADHPLMVNAAMDFDEQTLSPLFSLRLGVPGASHAFDIAGRLAFPAALLDRARARLGEERFQLERLLADLGARARAAAEHEAEGRALAERLRDRESELEKRLAGIEKERRERLAAADREGEGLLAEGRRRMEQVVRDLRSAGADRESIRRGKESLRRMGESLKSRRPRPEPAAVKPLEIGDRVRIPHLGVIGIVVEIRGEKLVADARGMRLTVERSNVTLLDGAEGSADSASGGTAARSADRSAAPVEKVGWNWGGPPPSTLQEIDLRGFRGDEAWDALDLLLDRAVPAGLSEIRVIHGVGTGRLAAHLRERLRSDARVVHFTEAPLDQGGHGVTLVRLAD